MDDLIKEISELKNKAAKYESFAEERIQLSKDLQEIAVKLKHMAVTVDPANRTVSERKPSRKYAELVDECVSKLESGMTITMKLLKSAYPDLNYKEHYTLMNKLGELANVSTAKDGATVRLFMNKA